MGELLLFFRQGGEDGLLFAEVAQALLRLLELRSQGVSVRLSREIC